MPYSFPDKIPTVAKNWSEAEQKKCVAAANAVLNDDGSEQDAIFACIRAAGKTKNPGGEEKSSQSAIWVDLFDARKVLDGEEVLLVPLMPDGYVRGGVRRPPITAQDLQMMALNFENRATSGYYQTILPLNKEHEPTEGKIGSIKAFRVGEDGGYALLELTESGRELLESGKFDYLSPEIRWQTQDIVTGVELGPSLVGAAVTNYPFFGDRTAMYSERAQEKMAEEMPAEAKQGFVLDLIAGLTSIIESIGWRVSDLKWVEGRGASELQSDSIVPELEAARKSIMWVLAQAASVLPDLASQRELLELYAVTGEEDGVRYPRSAYAIVLDDAEPDTWGARYKEYEDGVLVARPELLASAVDAVRAVGGPAGYRAWQQVLHTCADLGVDPDTFFGGSNMPSDKTQPEGSERQTDQYAERLSALESQVATYKEQIAERDQVIAQQGERLSTLTQERLAERFSREAETFSAIGVESEDLASHLMWLYQADTGEGRPHYTWFSGLLKTVNAGLEQSAAFSEAGHSREVPASDPWKRIEAAIAAKAKAKGVSANLGSANYSQFLSEVLDEDPELFKAYRSSLVDQ